MGLPVEVNNLMMGSLGGYTIGRSLRFRSSATAKLTRTPSVSSNQRTWTWSGWVKRGTLGAAQKIFWAGYTNGSTADGLVALGFTASDQLQHYVVETSVADRNNYSTSVYRDPSAWYHIVFIYDSTDATASNRQRIYVNGVQITSFAATSYVSQNYQADVNSSSFQHGIGIYGFNSTQYFDGYLAEVNFIDGQALTPSSFGAYDTNGVWQPKKYTGTYGTNGFYLPFSNTTSTTTLVQDSSGNGNNWTPNNISLTAGSTYDSMIDSPTVSASASNYAVLNPLDFQNANTYSNANLSVSLTNVSQSLAFGSMGFSSGKWYWEVNTTAGADAMLGVATQAGTLASRQFNGANSVYYYGGSGNKYVAGTGTAYGATYGTADIIGIALDLSANTITYYKNNTSQGAISLPSGIIGQILVPAFSSGTGTAVQSMNVNFGQRPFSYTPPTGFNALNTYNLPAPSIANGAQYMDIALRSGTAAAGSVSSLAFMPDFIWNKSRTAGVTGFQGHYLMDSVRGGSKPLSSDTTAAEGNNAQIITSFNSNGYSFGTYNGINGSSQTYVDWSWKAGGTGVTNTSGSITSTVSANTTAGFSVVTYTGTGANATVGHGLGVAPSFYVCKTRSNSGLDWQAYHVSLGATKFIKLNSTVAAGTQATVWNNTEPTSSVFSLGSAVDANTNAATYVAYCFAAVSGYSAFGSYVGSGSADGPFIFTGFRPRWVMVKRTDTTSNWVLFDSSRSTYNIASEELYPNLSNAEGTDPSFDFLSNGFKLRVTSTNKNASGGTYIYAAFSENPLKFSRAR